MKTKFKKLNMADNQDNYGNGEDLHDNEYNGNGGMDGQDNSYDQQQQHANGNSENSGRDDDRWVRDY